MDGNFCEIESVKRGKNIQLVKFIRNNREIESVTVCDMFEPLENLTIVCKLAGVDALLIIGAVE